jgi:hypothetical protein
MADGDSNFTNLVTSGPITAGGTFTLGGVGVTLLEGSDTWDAGSIADGNFESADVTVTGAAIGDYAIASFGVDTVDHQLTADVTAADTVTVTLSNSGATPTDFASTTVKVLVIQTS